MVCKKPRWIFLPKSLPIRNAEHEVNQKKLRKPIWHWTKNHYAMQIPCGECIGCLLDRAKDWATRCAAEMEIVKKGCFITLTYNNGKRTIKGQEDRDSLPINEKGLMTLDKKDLQDFWKRLRKYLNNEIKIRYVGCGEYGPKHQRPHYHAVIFGWKPEDLRFYKKNRTGDIVYKSETIQKIWGCGFITVGELNFETASYTARYVQKKAGINKKKRKYKPTFELKYTMQEVKSIIDEWFNNYDKLKICDNYFATQLYISAFMQLNNTNKIIKDVELKEPEFIVASNKPGIGYNYFKLEKEKILRNNGIMIKVKNKAKVFQVPKYFKKKWKEENPEEYYSWTYQQQIKAQKNNEKQINSLNFPENTPEWKKELEYIEHRNKLLELKAKLLRRINLEKNT